MVSTTSRGLVRYTTRYTTTIATIYRQNGMYPIFPERYWFVGGGRIRWKFGSLLSCLLVGGSVGTARCNCQHSCELGIKRLVLVVIGCSCKWLNGIWNKGGSEATWFGDKSCCELYPAAPDSTKANSLHCRRPELRPMFT